MKSSLNSPYTIEAKKIELSEAERKRRLRIVYDTLLDAASEHESQEKGKGKGGNNGS